MAVRTKRKDPKDLVLGLVALGLALVLMLALLGVLVLSQPEETPTEETTTAPPQTLPVNPYTAADFGLEGDYLKCLAGESLLGIDVSEFQLDIDWEQVKAAGVEFVMIRVGYRGSMEGNLYADSNAQTYYEGAKAAGLKVGGYFFSQAITVQEAVAEAEFALDVMSGWELDMPMVYDWEFMTENSRTASMDPRTLTDCTKAFCDVIRRAGFEPMIYFNLSQAEYMLYLKELTDYPWWLAMYTQEMDFPYAVDMWQYTCTGTVPGIEAPVDINLWLGE